MSRESLIFALSGIFFGLLVGWMLGSQTAGPPAAPAPPAAASSSEPPPPPLDEPRVAALEQQAAAEPANAAVRITLGNLYFDASRYDRAIPAYEAALTLDPRNVNVSTDLAVSYYSVGRVDDALAQLDRSLQVDPTHAKTLLNQGIIRAFGKSDLAGARESWERLIEVAPGTEEARRAQQGLNGIQAALSAPANPPAGSSAGDGQP
jgi:cytochrome c-type biogenesis protein CcmH/NrfG